MKRFILFLSFVALIFASHAAVIDPPFLNSNKDVEKQWKGKIIFLWSGLGEYAWAKRLENACQNLGWQCWIRNDPASISSNDRLILEKAPTSDEIQQLIEEQQPDCVISLRLPSIYSLEIPHYLAKTGTERDVSGKLHNPGNNLLSISGFLCCVPKLTSLKAYLEKNGKKFNALPWYPSSTATQYEPVIPRALFFCGFQWDSKRNGKEYRKMFSLLDQKGYLEIYGPVKKWTCAPNSVKGMTFDEEEFRKAMRNAGVVLVLHAERNLKLAAPAARIFEASAASCVIISDKHPFIVQEFGDCVLFVDDKQSGEALFQQIDAHLEWILSHPEEAKEMARKAHAIFSEKYTLEKQLLDFKNFHLEILSNEWHE